MKNYSLLLIFYFVCLYSYAQTYTVVDATTLQPIANANVRDVHSNYSTITNSKGEFELGPDVKEFIVWQEEYFSLTVSVSSINPDKKQIQLTPRSVKLNEVVVSSSKFEEKRDDVPQKVEVITARELENMNAQTSADMLIQTGNVMVQKSQQGGGSPVIRGFETNKVLIVMDGVRMNNAIYRAGHLQNVIRFDNNEMEKVEVVFGPGSTVYGSDALGGVMHFHTKKPTFASSDKKNVGATAFTRYSTVNNEKAGNFGFNIGGKKLAFLFSGTYTDFGDLRQGNVRNHFYGNSWKNIYHAERINGKDTMIKTEDENLQVQSGYKQYNILSKIAFKPNNTTLHSLNFIYTTTSNVFRYDRLQQYSGGKLKFAEWYYGPEKMTMLAYQLISTKKTKLYDQVHLSLAYQDIEESRNSRRFNNDNLTSQVEQVNVINFNTDFSKEINNHELRYGVEFCFNDVASSATVKNIVTDIKTDAVSRYPDGGSQMYWGAAYLTDNWEVNEKFILTAGMRFTNTSLTATFKDTSLMHFPYTKAEQNNSALTGSLGLIIKPTESWRIVIFGSTGFRAPNVDDLGKVFESSAGQLIVPNTNIKPEYTYNADLTLEKTFSKTIRVGATGYYTYLTNVITLQPFTFNGSDSILFDGVQSAVVAMVNKDKAYIYGLNLNIAADITNTFSITSTLNYTYGRIMTDTTDYPLDHISPLFGKTAMILKHKKFRAEFYALYSGWKRLKDYNVVGEDNLNQATAYGMPNWCTLNVRTSYQVNKFLRVQAGLENITDLNYRVFASGISAPGRNFTLTLRANF